MSFSENFPYLVPVWHSLSTHLNKSIFPNNIDPNLDFDLNGIGTFNDIEFKSHKQHLPFRINRTSLPFFINHDDRSYTQFAANNCLAYCPKRKVLFSSKDETINVINLNKSDPKESHQFSGDQQSSINPFCYRISNVWIHYMNEVNNIIDLRLYEEKDHLELMTHSRKSLNIFNYIDSPKETSKLQTKIKIDMNSKCFPSEKSLLNLWDRSVQFAEVFLASFIGDTNIYHWDIETDTSTIINSVDLAHEDDYSYQLINIKFLNNLNPFLYLYGSHKNIFLGDMRQDMFSNSKNNLSLIQCDQFVHFKPFELFYTFSLNPCEPHQFITSSDFNINFFDIRYPRRCVFQYRHMITGGFVNKLIAEPCQFEKESNQSLLVIASNNIKSCLMSFDYKSTIPPINLHSLYYLESPFSIINRYFPIESEWRGFNRGMQIMVNNNSIKNDENIFSIAFLLNNGDIFMQDFFKTYNQEEKNCQETKDAFKEFICDIQSHAGKTYLNEEFDYITKEYMDTVMKYLKHLKSIEAIDESKFTLMIANKNHCLTCYGTRLISEDLPQYSRDNLECFRKNKAKFCVCLRPILEIQEELEILGKNFDRNIQQNILSTNNSKVINNNEYKGKISFRDKDEIDFEFLKNNWFDNPESLGIRKYCRPMTKKIFDLWLQQQF